MLGLEGKEGREEGKGEEEEKEGKACTKFRSRCWDKHLLFYRFLCPLRTVVFLHSNHHSTGSTYLPARHRTRSCYKICTRRILGWHRSRPCKADCGVPQHSKTQEEGEEERVEG